MGTSPLFVDAVFTLAGIQTICTSLADDCWRAGHGRENDAARAALGRLNPVTTDDLDWGTVFVPLDFDPSDLLLPYRIRTEDLRHAVASLRVRLLAQSVVPPELRAALGPAAVRAAMSHLEELL